MDKTLNIEFLENTKRKKFQLKLISYFPLQVGGIDWENTYNLKLNNSFHQFLLFLEDRYDRYLTFIQNIKEAAIKESNRGTDNKNLPWIYTLVVKYKESTEVIEFFPYECELVEENE